MKQLLLLFLTATFATSIFAQVGVNTTTANSTLSVNGSFQTKYVEVTSSYALAINDYYVTYNGTSTATITLPSIGTGTASFAGRIYEIKNISTADITLVASNGNSLRTSSPTGITSFVIPAGYYVHVVNNANSSSGTWDLSFLGTTKLILFPDDATRFLGGTVYVKFGQASGGTLSSTKVISGTYSVGLNNTNINPTAGGIMSLIGEGYTISNPSTGIFDVKFNTSYTQIYGISVNILDAYGNGTTVTTGQNPDPSRSGNPMSTTANSQVSFISNSILRFKTGDNNGNLANRTFTFLVTGK
jgi:hypothetical protein